MIFLIGVFCLLIPIQSYAGPSFSERELRALKEMANGGATTAQGLDANFDIENEIDGATSANPFIVGNGTDYWAIYRDPTDGLQLNPVCGGVENDCNRVIKLLTSRYWEVINNSDVSLFRVTQAGAITAQTGAQYVASNLGVEFSESDTNPTCAAGNYTLYADASEAAMKVCTNGVVTTLGSGGSGGDTYVRKTSDEVVNNSATRQNDDELVFAADANSTYVMTLFIRYDGSTTADFNYDFTLPASAVGHKSTHHTPTSTTTCSGTSGVFVYNDMTVSDNNVGAAGVGTGSICVLTIDATVVTAGTSGNVQFRWAQATSDATNTTVRANSWLKYRKIP